MNRFVPRALALLAALAVLPGCENQNNVTVLPTPVTFTDMFPTDAPGTLTKSGGVTHPFIVTGAGTVVATLTTLAPDSTLLIGFSLGTWNGTACQTVLANDKAAQGAVIIGAATSAGNLCVRVYDVGTLTDSVTYQITVVHP